MRHQPIEFCRNKYGMVSSAGYLCIVSSENVLKETQCDQGS